jgi:hypothetical protein
MDANTASFTHYMTFSNIILCLLLGYRVSSINNTRRRLKMFDPALVKKYLKQNNMTQADLARFTEKTPRTIARWLNPKEKIGREEP